MRQGFDRALLVASMLLLPSVSGRAAESREAGSSPAGPHRQASAPAAPDRGEVSLKAPALVLVLYDPRGALPYGADAMTREVEVIFAGLGVSIGWKKGGLGVSFGGHLVVPELAVVLMPDGPRGEREEAHVMGQVLRGRAPNDVMWLFVPNVRWALGLRPQARKDAPLQEWQELGVALGRVAAHELIHAMAPAEPHAKEGLMRHSLDRHRLRAKDLIVDARCARAFRAGLAALKANDPETVSAPVVAGP